ncbi:energy transducer TonB [Candidatus Kapabacteria bacterium]|nr:energy transducer TonB [Candidatus Kapabacteria bacterium]
MAQQGIILPKISDYGAQEVKQQIQKYTGRAFLTTLLLLVLFFAAYFIIAKVQEATIVAPMMAPIVKTEMMDIPPQADEQKVDLPPPPPTPTVVTGGPAARAGTPIPVPDAEISPDLKEFADMDVMARASAEGGDGVDLGNFSENIKFADDLNVAVREEEPAESDFIPVEKFPEFDLVKLQKLVKYPDIARRSGIEGRVTLRVLVDKDGTIRKTKVAASDNEFLNQAALDALNGYGKFTPAIQNNAPVMCWVTVPITFKLKN